MRLIRRVYKLIAIVIWFFLVAAVTLPYQFGGWRGRKKISRLAQLWTKGVAKIINLKVKIVGKTPDVSSGLVVSNHLGYLDIITHGTMFPLRFTSTTAIDKWPIIGSIVASSQPILVDRDSRLASRKALRDFAKTVKRDMYLIVYPEGTSTDGKSGILPFKSTPFEAAAWGDIPVIPILTRYAEVPGRPTVCWYGDMTLMPHLWQILGFASIEVEVRLLDPVFPEGRSRKELAAAVHEYMANSYNEL